MHIKFISRKDRKVKFKKGRKVVDHNHCAPGTSDFAPFAIFFCGLCVKWICLVAHLSQDAFWASE